MVASLIRQLCASITKHTTEWWNGDLRTLKEQAISCVRSAVSNHAGESNELMMTILRDIVGLYRTLKRRSYGFHCQCCYCWRYLIRPTCCVRSILVLVAFFIHRCCKPTTTDVAAKKSTIRDLCTRNFLQLDNPLSVGLKQLDYYSTAKNLLWPGFFKPVEAVAVFFLRFRDARFIGRCCLSFGMSLLGLTDCCCNRQCSIIHRWAKW